MNSKKKLLYFIQLPPPLHGVSKVNKLISGNSIINKNFKVKIININYSSS